MVMVRHWMAVAVLATVGVGGAWAADAKAPATAAPTAAATEGAEAPGVTRTYNVGDLVRTTADYPFESAVRPVTGWGKGEGRNPGLIVEEKKDEKGKSAKPGIGLEELVKVIQGTIDPDSWADNGGTSGAIQPLGSLLIVTQTEARQKRVEDLLGAIRKEYGPLKTVSVRVRWVLL